MTDYYVLGVGHTAYGPYNLSDARECAQALAHKHNGEKTIEITGTVETAYSKRRDELPPEPPVNAPRPWQMREILDDARDAAKSEGQDA